MITVQGYGDEARLSESNASLKWVWFLKCCLCPSSSIVLPCLLLHLVSTSQSPPDLSPPTNKLQRLWICVSWGNSLPKAGNGPDFEKKKKKVLWGHCTLPVSWDKWFIKGQLIPCTCPEYWFNFFCICMNYTLCASLLCENSKRWNKNKRQQKALQRI